MPITSIQGRLLVECEKRLKLLDLELFETANIVRRKLPFKRDGLTEGLYISPVPETIEQANNEEDDFGYGYQVTQLKASNQSLAFDDDADALLRNRARIINHFLPTIEVPFPSVRECYTVKVEPAAVFDPSAFAAQFDGSAVVIRCTCRVRRQTF